MVKVTAALVKATVVTLPKIASMDVKLLLTGTSHVPTSVPLIGTLNDVLIVVGSAMAASY